MQDQLVFGVGRLLCALPLGSVVETVRPLPVQPVAGGGGALLGMAVIRGAAVPVVDTAVLAGDPGAVPSRFITVETSGGTVAFATGAVVGVRSVPRSAAQPSPVAGALVEAVGVLDGRPLLFLRPDSVLPHTLGTPAAAHESEAAMAQARGSEVAMVQGRGSEAAMVQAQGAAEAVPAGGGGRPGGGRAAA